MRKAQATYHAPDGDSKEVEVGGLHFRDGEPVELNSDEHPHLMGKLQGNQHFEFEAGDDDGERSNAPDRTRDLKAGIEEARDHDFEQDRRGDMDKKPVAELRQLAEERGIDHEGMSKAELREALKD
jgi:hypothetical protein